MRPPWPGTMLGFSYKKYTLQFGLNTAINKKINFGINLNFNYNDRLYPRQGAEDQYLSTLTQAPMYGPVIPDGSGHFTYRGDPYNYHNKNTVAIAATTQKLDRGYYLQNNMFVNVKLIKNLAWETRGGFNYSFTKSKDFRHAANKTPAFYQEIKDFLRPNLLVLNNCKQVLLEGVTFQNSPAWCLHPLMCEDLTVRNVYVKNPWNAQNGDGIDLESCKNVLIENSTFDVGDDGICIKSGRDEEGRKRGIPTENVIVRNNTVYHAHGGFVIGSEMSGGARNIYVDDCTFIGTDIGLRFKTSRGRGGIVENIFINNIAMKDIAGEAILFDMYYASVDPVPLSGDKRSPPKVETLPVSDATPQFRNFFLKNIVCNGAAKAIFVRGLPEMNIKNIVMEDMVLQSDIGLDMTEANGIAMKNVNLITKNSDPVVNINNSQDITFEKFHYNSGTKLLINITGDKTKRILVSQTDLTKTNQKVRFSYGATDSALLFK